VDTDFSFQFSEFQLFKKLTLPEFPRTLRATCMAKGKKSPTTQREGAT
jgi:hypothetical protein